MAVVGILTSIDILNSSVASNFSSLGVKSFQIMSGVLKKSTKRGQVRVNMVDAKSITYEEAKAFRQRYNFPSTISLSEVGTGSATAHYESIKSNPNIFVSGVDELYLNVADIKLQAGRNFSSYEAQSGSYVCIIGDALARKFFNNKVGPAIGKTISVGDEKYRVVGVTETRGGSMMRNLDNAVMIPLENCRAVYGEGSYTINVMVNDVNKKKMAREEAEGLFRGIRKIPLGAESNFTVNIDESLQTIFLDITKKVRYAAIAIGLITLLGSVIGLMNIMLVSIAERTREIGVSKALGARSATIKRQFLTESILISLFGGLFGVALGILAGNGIGLIFKSPFVMPWLWILTGFSLCALVGILSGIYPAIKASKLDPIVALRYE